MARRGCAAEYSSPPTSPKSSRLLCGVYGSMAGAGERRLQVLLVVTYALTDAQQTAETYVLRRGVCNSSVLVRCTELTFTLFIPGGGPPPCTGFFWPAFKLFSFAETTTWDVRSPQLRTATLGIGDAAQQHLPSRRRCL